MRAVYFGLYPGDSGGHFVWSLGGHASWLRASSPRNVHNVPFDAGDLDGKLAPKVTRDAGAARLHHIERADGWWSILAWHDYTGDRRPGSNSAIVVHGLVKYGFADMLQLARSLFPEVMDRLDRANVHMYMAEPIAVVPWEPPT